jgi:hypothetical protein
VRVGVGEGSTGGGTTPAGVDMGAGVLVAVALGESLARTATRVAAVFSLACELAHATARTAIASKRQIALRENPRRTSTSESNGGASTGVTSPFGCRGQERRLE